MQKNILFLLSIFIFLFVGGTGATPKKIVFTGGPGVGKTSLVLALELLGEYVVHEAATDYIRVQQAYGVDKPWENWEEFNLGIFNLNKQRGENIPSNVKRVLFDRGLPDSLAYIEPSLGIYKIVKSEIAKKRYDLVFIVEPLDFTETNNIRKEDREEALLLADKMDKTYRALGYEPIVVKRGV